MKLKTTKKQIKNQTNHIVCIGYYSAQHLLNNRNAFAYSGGQNGWDCDYYNVSNTIISKGYRTINKNTSFEYSK